MKKLLILLMIIISAVAGFTQSVGIGTSSPHSSSILHLNSTSKAFFPPSMTTQQMEEITNPQRGMMVYNDERRQYYLYTQYKRSVIVGNHTNLWEPIVTGPRILAWGLVDSINTGCSSSPDFSCTDIRVLNGSDNFSVAWDGPNRWFYLKLDNGYTQFNTDSFLLSVTPVGAGLVDLSTAVYEFPNQGPGSNETWATIKFVDISRSIAGYFNEQRRARTRFYFVLYDLRTDPF